MRSGGSSSAAQRSEDSVRFQFSFQYRFGPLPCTSRRFSLERRQRTRKTSAGDTLARAATVFIKIGSCRKKVDDALDHQTGDARVVLLGRRFLSFRSESSRILVSIKRPRPVRWHTPVSSSAQEIPDLRSNSRVLLTPVGEWPPAARARSLSRALPPVDKFGGLFLAEDGDR